MAMKLSTIELLPASQLHAPPTHSQVGSIPVSFLMVRKMGPWAALRPNPLICSPCA